MIRFVTAIVIVALSIFGAAANAQNTGANHTVRTGGTLPLTNNLALAANEARKGCFLQNNGTHNMLVGGAQSESFPITLPPGGIFYCGAEGMVLGDAIYITGTAADTYVLWWQ